MAHFARIDEGIVREVIVIDNADCGGGGGANNSRSGLAGGSGVAVLAFHN